MLRIADHAGAAREQGGEGEDVALRRAECA